MLILFDIDGTLLRGDGIGRVATQQAMLEIFGTESRLAHHHFGGKTDWQTLFELLSDQGYQENDIESHMPLYEERLAFYMLELVTKKHAVYALPGAIDLVMGLQQRFDVITGIVTGNVSSTAPIKLRAAGFDPAWFPVGAYGSEAIWRNDLPSLAIQRASAYAGRVITPQETVIVGDTVADIQCARAVGASVISVTTGFESREALEQAEPDYLVDDLIQVAHLLA